MNRRALYAARLAGAAGTVMLVGAAVVATNSQPTALAASATPSATEPATATRYVDPGVLPGAGENIDAPAYSIELRSFDIEAPIGALDGAASVVERGDRTTTTLSSDINFETDSADLTDRAHEVLDELIEDWEDDPPATVTIVGHTDSVDEDAYNQDLSERRAQAVKTYISARLPELEITAEGKGESEPIAAETNEDGTVSEEGRAANRRVEIVAER
ncbi:MULTISPECIES: OmpA family protein [unclassified Actinomyces]|uniref:OmpA family protein n=1 Tax=unclassified Actinomyces TaxID=2609248 RepID=UPI00192A1AE6|nr:MULTISPECIES: OmpA family protein [unclassified Actinomyces]